jgi:hypothetical protein
MKITLPEHFNLALNLKRAITNGAALVLFMSLMQITDPVALGAGFVFGLLGGSANDIIGWLGNREAIVAHNQKPEEDGE